MKKIVFLALLLLMPVVFAESSGYCKITRGENVGYWKFENSGSESLCSLVGSIFDLQTEWLSFNTFSASSVESNNDFCDGWSGECGVKLPINNVNNGSAPSLSSTNRKSTDLIVNNDEDKVGNAVDVARIQEIIDKSKENEAAGNDKVVTKKGFFTMVWEFILQLLSKVF